MSKVTVVLLKASDPIFKEGPRGYSPISVGERLRMMKAWQEETDGKSTNRSTGIQDSPSSVKRKP